MDRIFELIRAEREAQDVKWEGQGNSHERWLTILTEEVGEVAREVLEDDDPEML